MIDPTPTEVDLASNPREVATETALGFDQHVVVYERRRGRSVPLWILLPLLMAVASIASVSTWQVSRRVLRANARARPAAVRPEVAAPVTFLVDPPARGGDDSLSAPSLATESLEPYVVRPGPILTAAAAPDAPRAAPAALDASKNAVRPPAVDAAAFAAPELARVGAAPVQAAPRAAPVQAAPRAAPAPVLEVAPPAPPQAPPVAAALAPAPPADAVRAGDVIEQTLRDAARIANERGQIREHMVERAREGAVEDRRATLRRHDSERVEFHRGLRAILAQTEASIEDRAAAVEELCERSGDKVTPEVQRSYVRAAVNMPSRAETPVMILTYRRAGVPEPVILNILANERDRELGARRGPHTRDDVLLSAARMIVKTPPRGLPPVGAKPPPPPTPDPNVSTARTAPAH